MPPLPPPAPFPLGRTALLGEGVDLVVRFCAANDLDVPVVHVIQKSVWHFGSVCAFYRPDTERERRFLANPDGLGRDGYGTGINICLEHCGTPCSDAPGRNWTYPANVTDRSAYGVVCHELGHHADWTASVEKGRYGGEYSGLCKEEAGEPGLTSYAETNPWEFFAEAFRLFVTNPGLLKAVRPRTYAVLTRRWVPVRSGDWRRCLGPGVPAKVVKSLLNKGAR